MTRFPRSVLVSVISGAIFATFGTGACSSTDTVATADGGGGEADSAVGGGDGSSSDDGATGDVASDSSKTDGSSSGDGGGTCPQGVVKPKTGETCVGFGKKSPCNAACGEYGFLCYNGAPPNLNGCLQVSTTAFGDTYCCTENKCVTMPDQDAMCAAVAGKPHRYQCPPDGAGGNVAAPAGCVENGTGSTELEKFYCCP